jgi:hypothetical protein
MSTGAVWTCLEWDDATSTCTTEGWVAPASSWPTMTLADAQSIGLAIALIWAVGWGIRQLKRLIADA